MNICSEHNFGGVKAYEMGFGPVGPPLMNTIFYIIDGLLIDTGQYHMRKAFIEVMEQERIDRVLLTHYHEDHSGNAALAAKLTQAPVYGHTITIEKLKNGFDILPYQRIVWGTAPRCMVTKHPPTIESDRYRLIPIHTPGHSEDHMVYFEKANGWLFSGDLYLGSFIKYFRADEMISPTIRSLKKVLKLDFDSLFCAHNPKPNRGKKHLAKKLEFLENFYGEVSGLFKKGYDAKGIMLAMGRKEATAVKLFTNGNVSLENMINSVVTDIHE